MRKLAVADLLPSEIARRLLNELSKLMTSAEAPNALDRAMTEAWSRGKGYLRFTAFGSVEHVPYDEIHKGAR